MSDFKNETDINEFEEHAYMEDAIRDLRAEIGDLEDYAEQKEYLDENLWTKLEKFGKKISFTKDIVALYRYFTASEVSWYRKSIVIGALIYFITPIDAIPDIAPLIGYLDDLGVITAVLKYLGSELIPFYNN